MASRACELTGRQNPAMLLTLAAAYAETGRFREAMTAAKEGQEMAKAKGNKEIEEQAARLRTAFAAGQPYREPSGGTHSPK